jgi:agmatinase
MRRISEQCKFLGLGIRSLSAEEAQYLKSRSLKLISSQEIKDKKHWRNLVSRVLSDEVYLTIDLDVLDPSIMPAVGTPEPGGLRWEDILEIMRFVIENKKILGIDVVELCPLPNQVAPDFLAAKLIYKLIAYLFFR